MAAAEAETAEQALKQASMLVVKYVQSQLLPAACALRLIQDNSCLSKRLYPTCLSACIKQVKGGSSMYVLQDQAQRASDVQARHLALGQMASCKDLYSRELTDFQRALSKASHGSMYLAVPTSCCRCCRTFCCRA